MLLWTRKRWETNYNHTIDRNKNNIKYDWPYITYNSKTTKTLFVNLGIWVP